MILANVYYQVKCVLAVSSWFFVTNFLCVTSSVTSFGPSWNTWPSRPDDTKGGIPPPSPAASSSRRCVNRHEKLKETFPGLIHLVCGFIRLRATHNVNRA